MACLLIIISSILVTEQCSLKVVLVKNASLQFFTSLILNAFSITFRSFFNAISTTQSLVTPPRIKLFLGGYKHDCFYLL